MLVTGSRRQSGLLPLEAWDYADVEGIKIDLTIELDFCLLTLVLCFPDDSLRPPDALVRGLSFLVAD